MSSYSAGVVHTEKINKKYINNKGMAANANGTRPFRLYHTRPVVLPPMLYAMPID